MSDVMSRAACKGADPDLFFTPDHYEQPAVRRRRERQAKAICAGCPVTAPCLEFGMTTRFGTWGGLTEDDRRLLKRRLQIHRRKQREEAA